MDLIRDLEAAGQKETAFAILRRAVGTMSIPVLHREFASRCLRERDYKGALSHMTKYVPEHPEDGEAFLILAAIHTGLGNSSKAFRSLGRARELDVSEERIATFFSASPTRSSEKSSEEQAVSEETTLVLNREALDQTAEERRRSRGEGDWSAMQTGPREGTQNIQRPAAPYDSHLLICKIQASLEASRDGDTDPFRPILDDESDAEIEPTQILREEDIPLPASHKRTIEESSPDLKAELAASESEVGLDADDSSASMDEQDVSRLSWDRLPSEKQSASPSSDEAKPTVSAESGQDQGHAQSEASSLTWDKLPGEESTPQESEKPVADDKDEQPVTEPLKEASSEVKEQPQTERSVALTPALQPSPARESRKSDTPPSSDKTTRLKIGIPAVLGIIVVAWVGLGMAQYGQLAATAEEAYQHRIADSYEDHLKAIELLRHAEEESRILPSVVDAVFFELLPAVPNNNVAAKRRNIGADASELAAFIEWRFEWSGARNGADGEVISGSDDAALVAAQIYRKLLAGEVRQAHELVDKNWERYSDSPAVQWAAAAVVLELDEPGELDGLQSALQESVDESLWRQLMLARLAYQRRGDDAIDELQQFADNHPDHPEGQIYLALALGADDDRRSGLEERLQRWIDDGEVSFGPYQRARAIHALGAFAAADGEFEVAEEYFKRGIEEAPMRHELYPAPADFFVDRARFDEAKRMLDEMGEQLADDAHPGLLVRRAELALLEGRADTAREVLEEIEDPPANANWIRGLAHLDLEEFSAARQTFEDLAAQTNNGVGAEAYALYARMLIDVGDAEEIFEEYGDFVGSPQIHRPQALAARVVAEHTPSRSQRRRSITTARDELLAALDIDPTDIFTRYELCSAEIDLGMEEEAEESCKSAFDHNSAYWPGALHYVRLRTRQGRYEEARELHSEISAHHDEAGWPMNAAEIRILIGLREFEEARQRLEETAEDAVDEVEHAILSGRLEFARYDYEAAREHFAEARELDSDNDEAAVLYGHTLVRLGNRSEANDLLLDLLSAPVWGGYAWYALGELRRRQGRFSDVRTNLSRADERLEAHIFPPEIYVNIDVELIRAWQERYSWDHSEIENLFESAREKAGDEEIVELMIVDGAYHIDKRRPARRAARSILERALELDPLHCEGWELLEEVYQTQNASSELRQLRADRPESCS